MLAGYSGTPLPKKLGIKTGSTVALFDAPEGFLESLEPGSTGFTVGAENADVIVLFAEWEERLTELLKVAVPAMKVNGGLWIGWPKKASKVPTDITEDRLRDILLPTGLVDNKVCAIDEKWSGLRFVWRLDRR
jgi:hypothetical protein